MGMVMLHEASVSVLLQSPLSPSLSLVKQQSGWETPPTQLQGPAGSLQKLKASPATGQETWTLSPPASRS